MGTDLPYAAEAETSLSREELDVLRKQYYKEIEQGHVTTQSKFNYGESERRGWMGVGRGRGAWAVAMEERTCAQLSSGLVRTGPLVHEGVDEQGCAPGGDHHRMFTPQPLRLAGNSECGVRSEPVCAALDEGDSA